MFNGDHANRSGSQQKREHPSGPCETQEGRESDTDGSLGFEAVTLEARVHFLFFGTK